MKRFDILFHLVFISSVEYLLCLPTRQDVVESCVGGCFKPKIKTNTSEYYLKIEIIKNDLLAKLGLDTPPITIAQQKNVPQVLIDDYWRDVVRHQREEKRRAYESVRKMVVPATVVKTAGCLDPYCIQFSHIAESLDSTITDLKLWVYQEPTLKRQDQENILRIVSLGNDPLNMNSSKVIATRRILATTQGWIKIDIRSTNDWISRTYRGHTKIGLRLTLDCSQCKLILGNGNTPLLDFFEKTAIKQRKRRSMRCTSQSDTCCLDDFYLNFKDIHWDTWIVAPKGFNARQCRGRCNSVHAVHAVSNEHGGILRAIAQNEKNELKLCCTSQKYTSLEILFRNTEGNLVRQEIKNMIATECGCA